MAKYTFEIYETWKIMKTFEAETLEDAWELATEYANKFDLDTDKAFFVSNKVDILGDE